MPFVKTWNRRKRKVLDEQVIREVAIAEILQPTLLVTQELLEVNRVVFKEQVPVIADVIFREEEQSAEVYFPIEEERYYLVVFLGGEPQIVPRMTVMSAGNRVYFYAKSTEHRVSELIALVGIEPTRTWEKRKSIRHYGIEVCPYAKETGEVEDKLRTLISVLLPFTDNIHVLSTKAGVGINIAYWGYKEQMWGIHFGTDIIQGLAVLNLSVDVDLYASGPE